MEHYVGTKQVLATPMTRQEYNDYRGWTLPANEDGGDEGMLVEYVDGGEPNDSRHAGYISWSPKDVFDRFYRQYEDNFVGRMQLEKDELSAKLAKISKFMKRRAFQKMRVERKSMLNQQKNAMEEYLDILTRRIAFEKADQPASSDSE